MIYSETLDKALKVAALAHGKAGQYRKGTDIPYIIHPVGTMIIASTATSNEDVLIACLLHDILEDVSESIYSKDMMLGDFGQNVVEIVLDVTKNKNAKDWYEQSNDYLSHLKNKASNEAVIVSACDKIHNLLSTVEDYKEIGDEIWNRFSTKNYKDQLWWYESILNVISFRRAPLILVNNLSDLIKELKSIKLINE
jgi:(p)ppGpp synthase/HD superfamily hydrolase